MESKMVNGGPSHKISCIFGDIDRMEKINADIKTSRAVIEKQDLVLPLNVV